MKPMDKFLIAISIVALHYTAVYGWRSFKIVFISFPYEFNSDFLDAKIQIVNNSAGDTAINVIINVIEEIRDPSLNIIISLQSDTENYTTLWNRTVNLCQFLKLRQTEPILRVAYEDILRHDGNFVKSCPIKKATYTVREYRMDEELLPSYVPETNFIIEMKLHSAKKTLLKGLLHGKIDKSKGFNNLKMFSLG